MKDRVFLADLLPANLDACNASQSFLQSGFWGSFKARFGWNARSFEVTLKSGAARLVFPLLVIRRRLGPGISFAYVPWGPELCGVDPDARGKALEEIADSLKGYLPKDTAFIRFDPPWYTEDVNGLSPKLQPPFFRAAADIQAPDTVLVSLEGSGDDILARMKAKWRYNAKLAVKKGVVVERPDENGLEVFYSLLKETAQRDGISVHHIDYYKTLFSHCAEYRAKADSEHSVERVPVLHLYTARHEREVLAAIVVLFRGREAVYLYGASSNSKRNLMAPYALQVRAMLDAKEAGCAEYDLFGIPPDENPNHPMAGLYQFKTGFGGRVIHRPGSWDYPYRPLLMKVFFILESLRKKMKDHKKNKKPNNPDRD